MKTGAIATTGMEVACCSFNCFHFSGALEDCRLLAEVHMWAKRENY